MACSVVLGCCIFPPPITVPNIRTTQSTTHPHIQKLLITHCRSKNGIRPPSQEFHSSWITRNTATAGRRTRHSWISAISAIDNGSNAHSPPSSSTLPSRISPWLMLPPSFENGNMVYKFYSLKDDKVLSINKRDPGADAGDDEPSDDSELVGSSHGWLVLYNRRNCDLFLSNPLSRRHIKLPPLHNLPGFPKANLERGSGGVNSVILSSSPDDKDCRALMIYGRPHFPAFCCPGLGSPTQWTPITRLHRCFHRSCVYSSTQKLFFSVDDLYDIVVFDIAGDPKSSPPRSFIMDDPGLENEDFPWPYHDRDWLDKCHNRQFLVVADLLPNSNGDLLHVWRHTMKEMYPDGSSANETIHDDDHDDADRVRYPYKTIDFTVDVYDAKKKEWYNMGDTLDGLAIFIGNNHSFAMRACDFPELKPDSIYFTDERYVMSSASYPKKCNFGGHDIGIYNFKDKTFSPCYYPCDYESIKRIEPAPIWFTPSPF